MQTVMLVVIALLFLAFILMLFSFFMFNDFQNRFSRFSKKTVGRIVDIKTIGEPDNPDNFAQYPVYSFKTGTMQEVKSELPIELKVQPILDKPEWIYYNSDNPNEFITEEYLNKQKRLSQLIFFVSVLIAVLGFAILSIYFLAR